MTENEYKTAKVLYCMNHFAGYCPTVGEMAKISGFAKTTVQRHIVKFAKDGFVEIIPMKRGRAKFRISPTKKLWALARENGWKS